MRDPSGHEAARRSREMNPAAFAAGALIGACLLGAPRDAAATEDSERRGQASYRRHCVQCHGESADGRGPLASKYTPRPSNLARSERSDEYKAQIITLGGKALGRSAVMPEWGLELSGQEILALVDYLRKVSDDAARSRRSAARTP